MGKKKTKSGKKLRRKDGREDVKASTSLPPSVDGQLRCFLRVTASKISWLTTRPPDVFFIRLKWWGEQSNGSIFRPSDGREESKSTVRKTARYPIRCGPKQFAHYLNAMSSCVFELLKGQQMVCIGKATISELGILTPQKPILGVYPIFSNQKAEKLADINVSIKFEPLPVSYDSSSSVPTTDVSLPAQQGQTSTAQPSILKKQRKTSSGRSSSSYQAPSSDLEGDKRDRQTPSGVDDDYSFVIGPGAGGYRKLEEGTKTEKERYEPQPAKILHDSSVSDTGMDKFSSSQMYRSLSRRKQFEVQPTSDAGKHLISAILDKGNKLMDSMIRAQCEAEPQGPNLEDLKPDQSHESARWDTGVHPLRRYSNLELHPLRRSSSGELFRELLKDDKSSSGFIEGVKRLKREEPKLATDPTVDLVVDDVIGDKELNEVKTRLGTSPADSIDSDFNDVFDGLTTDSDDPLHEQSILEELFYKGQRSSSDSDGLSDLFLSSDSEAETSRKNKKSHRKSLRKLRKHKLDQRKADNRSHDKPTKPDQMKEDRDMTGEREENRETSDAKDEDECLDSSSVTSLLHSSIKGIEGLSVERLTLLGRVHAARVVVDTLTLFPGISYSLGASSRIPRKIPDNATVRGKPPRPQIKSTYFVEYQFPITATVEDSEYLNNMATEVMRVVSKKVTENKGTSEIQFGHRSIFPIQFDGSTIDHWLTRLLVLRIYHKLAGQKTPSLIAVASIPLKNILQSPNLSVVMDLPVKRKNHQERSTSSSSLATETTSTSPDDKSSQLGKIQVSVELTSDNKDFKAALARTKIAEIKGAKLISLSTLKKRNMKSKDIPRRKNPKEDTISKDVRSFGEVRSHQGEERNHQRIDSRTDYSNVGGVAVRTHPSTDVGNNEGASQDEHLTLFTLLLIPEGRGITVHGLKPLASRNVNSALPSIVPIGPNAEYGRDFVTRNAYLVCKMFWSDDAVHSHVCWGTSQPQFNFSQVAPVLLIPSLLERTRNNFMVIEVWDKKTSGQNDVLIGMAKLPLHQFYMSFRDQKIANAILKSQYPVVGFDNFAPIVNPFTGVHFGQVKVLLAMGAFHQITALQRLKGDMAMDITKPERPVQYFERSEQTVPKESRPTKATKEETSSVEHIFEVVVEGVRSLPQGEDFVWGEADCFIQYHFPSQEKQYNQLQGSLGLKSFRSATTLCLPDPMFNEVTRHRMSLPLNVPVQRELLTACVGVGGAAGGIPFELWCRYYYPNVRDQVIAKASLPLAKLCAMVTMQRGGEPSIQTFNLPLRTMLEEDGDQVTAGGILDVTVSYKHSAVKQEQSLPSGLSTSPHVSLTVSVLRATGLQAAAKSLARYQPSLQYASDVGVNTFVTVHVSFLPKEEMKRSGAIARSFSPELSHHMDFSCPLILSTEGQRTESMENELSLAEVLEMAELEVKVWHQGQHSLEEGAILHSDQDNSISGRQMVAPPSEILLGSTRVPLKYLLLKKTGLHGWFTISIPTQDQWNATQEDHSLGRPATTQPYSLNTDGGSLELVIKFGRKMDREKVLEVGQRMGWSSPILLDEDDEISEGSSLPVTISIQIDKIYFNEQLALRPGQARIENNQLVYVRYQFYDKRPTCSRQSIVKERQERSSWIDTKHIEHIKLLTNPALNWYLKEEQLEIQVWVIQGTQESRQQMESHPRKTDKLIGSAHLDLINLVTNSGRSRSISGLFPLIKPGVDNMHGACVKVTITLSFGQHQQMVTNSTDEYASDEQPEHSKQDGRDTQELSDDGTEATNPPLEPEEEVIEPIAFELQIERAMGLCTSPNRWNSKLLNTYVTLQAGESSPLITSTVPESTRPVWNHYQELVLNPQEVIEKQHLIFKVWHQTTGRQDMSCDRMLGFTSVDLGPLLVGFRSLNGWYNIMDFTSQVKGQIKIAITPKRELNQLKTRAVRFMNQGMASPNTSGHLPPIHSSHPYHYQSTNTSTTVPVSTDSSAAARERHHQTHLRGVRESHQRLHSNRRSWEKEEPSLSHLKETLRKNLADLDSLKEKLDRKRRCLDGLEEEEADTNDKDGDDEQDEVEVQPTTQMYGRGEAGRGLYGNQEDLLDPTTSRNVQYVQMSEEDENVRGQSEDVRRQSEDVRRQSESLGDSESENESSIVIPRTLNDVTPDGRINGQRTGGTEEGLVEDDREEFEEVSTETPEAALEWIQNRILQVVGPGVNNEMGRNDEEAIQEADESERLGVEVREESKLAKTDKEGSVDQGEVDGDSELSRSSSQEEEEEEASFASSRDEGDVCDSSPGMGMVRPSSDNEGYVDVEVDRPVIGPQDETEALTETDEELETESEDRRDQPDLDGVTKGSVSVLIGPADSEDTLERPLTVSGRSTEVPVHGNQENRQTEDTAVAFQLPNFFLPGEDLASAMRTLDSAVSRPNLRSPEVGSLSERIQAARDVAKRLEESSKEERPTSQMHRVKKYARTQPTAEEAKRIAKIFSAKYSST
ncbi:C2 domain-containing protein 3-like isoform X2 [Apostichopus japonicus]|uniref:C2 domain-containing protein 3-like isoform X2 n=1 Tax=Stichopus japonicus TaxID=307972 RepID=UPI003AB70624